MYWLGILCIFFITVMGNAGGISGGGSTIPFMAICFCLSVKECVPIANVSSLVSPLIRFTINYY